MEMPLHFYIGPTKYFLHEQTANHDLAVLLKANGYAILNVITSLLLKMHRVFYMVHAPSTATQ